jgi:N-methylhydantoinase A
LAEGIVRVVNATMEKAIRVVSIQQGHDPREFSLLCFGGAGALHACELAAALSMCRVIVPPAPGALSAYGILVSDVVKNFSRTAPMPLSQQSFFRAKQAIDLIFRELTIQARSEMATEGWTGAPKLQYAVDMRYQGQGFELPVPWHSSSKVLEEFHAAHRRRFGYQHTERQTEVVTFRLRASLPQKSGRFVQPRPAKQVSSSEAAVYFHGKNQQATVLKRESLHSGFTARGPLVVTEYTATTFVPLGWKLSMHRSGALLIEQDENENKDRRKKKRRSI